MTYKKRKSKGIQRDCTWRPNVSSSLFENIFKPKLFFNSSFSETQTHSSTLMSIAALFTVVEMWNTSMNECIKYCTMAFRLSELFIKNTLLSKSLIL
jgi:hypothetical protein